MRFLVVDGCPCPRSVAPYIALILRRAGQTASSVYRGEDAAAILHAHGKSTQAEIHRQFPAISNPPGFSQHELRSDGPAANNGIGRGERLPEWMVGVDSGTDSPASRDAITQAAAHYGWSVEHPYSRGVELHHWRLDRQPRPKGLKQRAQIISLRRQLPSR